MEPIPLVLEEEVALEGLDGITLETLWFRISERLNLSLPFTQKFKNTLWNITLKNNELEFFEINQIRLTPTRLDRMMLDSEDPNGEIENLVKESYSIYSYHPVSDPLIRGSCEEFTTRKKIAREYLQQMELEEIEELYGCRMVIVASQKIREEVLIPSNIGRDCDINNHTYCFLERIGRSRYFGEATSGPNSALDVVKDSKLLHYFRNLLLRNNLVMRQPIQTKIRGKTIQIQLFHLPRFFSIVQSNHMVLTEKLFDFLIQKSPSYASLSEEARTHLGMNQKAFRAFLKSKEHVFEYGIIPKHELFPLEEKNNKKGKLLMVNAVKIKDPDFDVFSLYNDEKEEFEEESGYLDVSNQLMNTSLTWQAIEKIKESESAGISQAELAKFFGLSRLNSRAVVRKATKKYDITSYLKDEGRQRTSKYVHKKYKNAKAKKFVEQIARLVKKAEENSAQLSPIHITPQESMQESPDVTECDTRISIPLNLINIDSNEMELLDLIETLPTDEITTNVTQEEPYVMTVDEPCMIGNIENVEVTMKFLNTLPGTKPSKGFANALSQNKVSEKVLNRMNLILDYLKEKTIIDGVHLLNYVREKENECKEKICRRSMFTICNQLAADNFLKVIEMELSSPTKTVKTLYIGEPHITLDMRCWHSIIEEQKIQQFLRPMPANKLELKLEPSISCLSFESKESFKVEEFSAQSLKYSTEPFPKFQKYKIFHEFLFYLIRDYPANHPKIPIGQAMKIWKKENQNIPDLEEISATIPVCYSTDFNWKMFVPPLNPYRGYENGWGLLRDIIHRIPLILYIKLTRFGGYAPDVKEYLDDPIKCNYLIHFLPPPMRKALLQGRKHVMVFFEICKRLCILGLLQIGPNKSKETDYTYIYLNRNASILDTTTNSGTYLQVDVKEYDQNYYFFDSTDVVASYWKDLMNICVNTPLGKVNDPSFEISPERVKQELIQYYAVQTAETAPQNDIDEIPGNKRGVGGLDTFLNAHMRINWSKIPFTKVKKAKKKVVKKKIKKQRVEKAVIIKKKIVAVKKRIRKKTSVIKHVPTKAETLTGIHGGAIVRRNREIKIKEKEKKKKKILNDEVDKEALKRLDQSGRCVWSDLEDETLLVIKAAMKFLFKSEAQCTYYCPSTVIRDILHWRTDKALDKTTNACKRRILYLLKHKAQCKERMNLYVEELSVTREFLKYNNFLDNLLKKYKKSKDIYNVIKIHIVELVFRMHQLFLKQYTSNSTENEKLIELPCIFNRLENYCTIIACESGNEFKYKEPTNLLQVEIASLSTFVHSTLCCLHDKTSNEYYHFETYKLYAENNLTEATNILRGLHVISRKAHSKHRYQLSNRYALQMSSLHVPIELYDEYLEGMKTLSLVNSPFQLKSLNCGMIFMLAEMLNQNKISLTLEKADKLIMVDPSLRNMTNFEAISNNYLAAQKALKEEVIRKSKEKKKELSFPQDNTSDTHFYHAEDPIEIFFKFNDFYLHIFCLLKAIDNEEILKADRWCIENHEKEVDKCSVKNCIFANNEESFGDQIKKIASECLKTVEELLQASPQEENENLITKENFVNFFDAKIAEFEKSDADNFRKDVNKKLMSEMHQKLSTQAILSYIQQLATDNDQEDGAWLTEYKKISIENSDEIFDEEEESDPIKHSTISHQLKEFNVPMRSSDSFVVNLSTIYIDIAGEKGEEVIIDEDTYDKRLLSYDQQMRNALIENIKHRHVWMPDDLIKNPIDSDDENLQAVCVFIIEKGEMGATAEEMLEKFENKTDLQNYVEALIKQKIILCTGVNQLRFIHKSYSGKWLCPTFYLTEEGDKDELSEPPEKKAKIDETEPEKKFTQHPYYVLPAPWIRVGPLNRTINYRCLHKWLGTILNYLSITPGILLTDLRMKFNVLNAVQIRNLCEILEEIGCVKILAHDQLQVDVFSEYFGENDIEPATYFDKFDQTFVEVTTDAFQRLAAFIGKHYYKTHFI